MDARPAPANAGFSPFQLPITAIMSTVLRFKADRVMISHDMRIFWEFNGTRRGGGRVIRFPEGAVAVSARKILWCYVGACDIMRRCRGEEGSRDEAGVIADIAGGL